MGEAEETVDLKELSKKLVEEARAEEREQVMQAQKQLFDIKIKKHELKALERETAYEEQIKHLNERIEELESDLTTYTNVATRAADQVEELVTENEYLAGDLAIVNKERVQLKDTLENTRTLLRNKISTLKAELKKCETAGLINIDWPSFMV